MRNASLQLSAQQVQQLPLGQRAYLPTARKHTELAEPYTPLKTTDEDLSQQNLKPNTSRQYQKMDDEGSNLHKYLQSSVRRKYERNEQSHAASTSGRYASNHRKDSNAITRTNHEIYRPVLQPADMSSRFQSKRSSHIVHQVNSSYQPTAEGIESRNSLLNATNPIKRDRPSYIGPNEKVISLDKHAVN